ncbi:F0F1 ATP synthase subunit delta [uncultured Cohaesibacter sp.]|uniref:F0F1 ATP synthase subunit delta n=1 Tax=uncultured Cohaesibacter sp. TaxID=1002546 RepID=UPI0029C89A5C|nr:F0F1 ATP synthase subunit delta [uncultured Cohaesibacter sp.]
MTIDWWTLGLETVNVVILIWLLARFLFKPIRGIIEERQRAVRSLLEEAEGTRNEAKAERAKARKETEDIAAQRATLIASAKQEAGQERQAIIDAAVAEAEKSRSTVRAELAELRKAEADRIVDEAGLLALDIAAKLLARLPPAVLTASFIDGLTKAVAELPEATRAGIGRDGPIFLRTAAKLPPDAQEHLQEGLEALLGRSITLDVHVTPELIAGLELDAPHAIVRNHFRFDLDRIKRELADHD